MAIDASIYGQIRPPTINTPFENLSQVLQVRQQQQQVASNRALEQERLQKLGKEAQAEADQQTFYRIIAASKTPDEAQARIQTEAPSLYQPFLKQRADLDAKAGEIAKAKVEAKRVQADIATKGQEYAAPFLQLVEKSHYDPGTFSFALSTIKSHFEDFPAEQMLAQTGGDPAKIKHLIDGFKSPQQQHADIAGVRQANEAPGQVATSAMQQQVAAGMTGGLTPDQQRQGAQTQSANAIAAGHLGVARQREAREQAAAAGGAGGALDEAGQELLATQYRVVGSSAIPTRISGADRAKIINQAAAQMKVLGQSPAVAIQRQYALKADAGSLNKISTMAATASAFENKAIQQADLVRDLSARVDRTQFPAINRALLAGKKDFLGDADTQLLYNALTTFTAEYAKIIEGSTGSAAGSTDAARKASASLAHAALNKDTLAKTLDLMQKEMRYTIQGYDATKDAITAKMGGVPAAPSPAAPPAGETPEQRIKRLVGGG